MAPETTARPASTAGRCASRYPVRKSCKLSRWHSSFLLPSEATVGPRELQEVLTMLLRYDPFRELDRMTEQAFNRPVTTAMPMDAIRHGDEVVISFDLPGVDPSSIDLT